MRLAIRKEQMLVMEALAQESFVRRIARHLLENFPQAVIQLPDGQKTPVAALDEEMLFDLVRTGVERAKSHGLTLESSIAAFVAVMFEVAPNFDSHRLCQVLLRDKDVEPDKRIGELLNVLSEKNWESIRADYDPRAWKTNPDAADDAQPGEPKNAETAKHADAAKEQKEKSASEKQPASENPVEHIKTQPNMMDFEETVKIDFEE